MGHYDDFRNADKDEAYRKEKQELVSKIEYELMDKDKKELKLILRFVKNTNSIMDAINVFKF